MIKVLHTSEQKARYMKRPDGPINVFVASPNDVLHLRDALEQIVDKEHNQPSLKNQKKLKFHLYKWETHKSIGYDGDNFQDNIFKEFGDWCDIFILIFWKTLGAGGTEKEYVKFLDHFREINPNIAFWPLVYNEKVYLHKKDKEEVVNTSDINKLRKFLKEHQPKWTQIGIQWGSIEGEEEFKDAIRPLFSNYKLPD